MKIQFGNFEGDPPRHGVVPRVITGTENDTSHHFRIRDQSFSFGHHAIDCFSIFSNEARYGCFRAIEPNEVIVCILNAPFDISESATGIVLGVSSSTGQPMYQSTLWSTQSAEIVRDLSDDIVFISSDLSLPELAETSSLNEFDEEIDLAKSLRSLESLAQQMRKSRPLNRSPELLALAKRAVTAMSERTSEDVDDWARKLASDIKDAAD